jgi:hypothetical protein
MTEPLRDYHRTRCPACGVVCEQHSRPVLLPGGDKHSAYECVECEAIYLVADTDAPTVALPSAGDEP